MLTFEQTAISTLIEQHHHALNSNQITNGWGSGPIVDNFSGIIGAFFRLFGQQTRTPGSYARDPGDGEHGATRETFHPMVRVRKSKRPEWKPPAMKGYECVEPDGEGKPWQWLKKGVRPLSEYVMLPSKTMRVSYEDSVGITRYTTIGSMSRALCPAAILIELDEANNIEKTLENGV
jgi:hypothetical protein